MGVDWSMAAVAAVLVCFVVPYLVTMLKGGVKSIRTGSRRCVRLKWEDVPDGRVRECSLARNWYQSYFHTATYARSRCGNHSSSIRKSIIADTKIVVETDIDQARAVMYVVRMVVMV